MAGSPKPAYTPDRGASTPGMQPGSTGSGLPPRSGNARAPGSMSRPASWAGRRAAHADVVRHLGMPGGPRDRAGLLHNTRWRIAAAALAVLLVRAAQRAPPPGPLHTLPRPAASPRFSCLLPPAPLPSLPRSST